jgi:hypothetical protein
MTRVRSLNYAVISGRRTAATLMRQTATHSRPTLGSGGLETWATVNAAVPCRPFLTTLDTAGGGVTGFFNHEARRRIMLPYNTDVKVGDRLTIGSATYDILAEESNGITAVARIVIGQLVVTYGAST